jgi:hypothetical protein
MGHKRTFGNVRQESALPPEDADVPHPLAPLRARRERPRNRCAAEKRDELAAFHVWMAPAWQEKT